MNTSFYSDEELKEIGLSVYGENVLISRKASFYNPMSIKIGNNVRIDDFCILSGTVTIGNNIHIAAYTALYGSEKGIFIDDFANLSSRVTVYAVSDDYSGESMTNPMIPEEFKILTHGKVHIKRHVIIGSGSIILPGVELGEGCAIGALSLINRNLPEWSIFSGIPAKFLRLRSKKLLDFETRFNLRNQK